MEKLLLLGQTKGSNHVINLTGPTHKKYFLSYEGHENIFANAQETTQYSTLFRMNYLSQPITGFINKNSQLFSGRVNLLISSSYRLDAIN